MSIFSYIFCRSSLCFATSSAQTVSVASWFLSSRASQACKFISLSSSFLVISSGVSNAGSAPSAVNLVIGAAAAAEEVAIDVDVVDDDAVDDDTGWGGNCAAREVLWLCC